MAQDAQTSPYTQLVARLPRAEVPKDPDQYIFFGDDTDDRYKFLSNLYETKMWDEVEGCFFSSAEQ